MVMRLLPRFQWMAWEAKICVEGTEFFLVALEKAMCPAMSKQPELLWKSVDGGGMLGVSWGRQ